MGRYAISVCSLPYTLFFLLASGVQSWSQELVLDVQQDSWLHGLTGNTNEGKNTRLSICPSANYWIYVKFDLEGIDGEVTAAELRLSRFSGSRPQEISAYFIPDDSWSEADLTGSTRPDPRNPSPDDSLDMTGSSNGNTWSWSSSALTDVVRQEAAGDGVLTLMVREDPSETVDVRHFHSRESSEGQGPQLILTVEPLVEETKEVVDETWQVTDVGVGTKPSFDFDANDRVHVMGMTELMDGVVWHAAADSPSGPWNPSVIATGYYYGPGDLVADANGVAHIAWHDHDLQDPRHATVDSEGNVKFYLISTPGSHDGWDNALTFDSQGVLHQSSVNPVSFGASRSLEYGHFDGMAWTYETVTKSGPFMYGLGTSIAVDKEGNVHVVYCQSDDWLDPGPLKYAVQKAGEWQTSAVICDGIRGRFPTLALDHWERPHVAWLDINEADPSRACVRYGILNNEEWEVETVDTLENIELSFFGARKSVSLALDTLYRPHLAYGDKRVVKYAHKPFGDWEGTTVLEHEDEIYNGLVVLRLDSQEKPAIVFWQQGPDNQQGLVRLASAGVNCDDTPELCSNQPISFDTSACDDIQSPLKSDHCNAFSRGDCSGDGTYEPSDAIFGLGVLFLREDLPPCFNACDANDDDSVDIADMVYILFDHFSGGDRPPPPYPNCGEDPTPNELPCPTDAACP